MIRISSRLAAVVAACSMLPACGGGGSGTSQGVTPPAKTPSTGGMAQFVVHVPAKPKIASAKRPAYITPNVQGIDFTVTSNAGVAWAGNGYYYYPLTPQSTYCSNGGSGLTCTLPIAAPSGGDTFKVNLYDDAAAPGLGYVVATATVMATIVANQVNTVSITTSGVPTFAVIGANNAYPTTLSPTTISLPTTITDPDGNIIVGTYDVPLTVTNSDTSGATTLSKTTLTQASDSSALTLTYNGSSTNQATIALMSSSPAYPFGPTSPLNTTTIVPGVAGPNVVPGALYFAHATAAAQSISIAGANGSTGPFTVTNTGAGSCASYVSVSGSSPVFTITPTAATFNTSNPLNTAGVCYITIKDSASRSNTVPVMISP